jgi:hypothetical protein
MPLRNLLNDKKPLQDRIKLVSTKIRIKPAKGAKKKAPKRKDLTEALHEKWFFNLEPEYFVELQKEWNDNKLKITLKPQENYDQWLNYFKTLPPNTIRLLAKTGMDILPTEAYAALARWHDIISNPGRIDKIHQAGLTNPNKNKDAKTISQLAAENDRLGVLMAVRDSIADKLEKGAGARDTAALSREMTEVMTQIADFEKRLGPKKNTKLGELLNNMPDEVKRKRPGKNGGGSRNTSFKSRVTIEDLET